MSEELTFVKSLKESVVSVGELKKATVYLQSQTVVREGRRHRELEHAQHRNPPALVSTN